MKKRKDIVGVILAGGKSSRIGYNKALLNYKGKPFIQIITETLREVFEKIIIISDKKGDYKFLNLPIFEDIYKDCGPLGGIHSAFVNSESENIFITSCDLPLINPPSIKYLIKRHHKNMITVFSVENQIQPLFGLYNRSCFTYLEDRLKRKQYSVLRFLNDVPSNIIYVNSLPTHRFLKNLKNINTKEDYCDTISKID